MFCKSCSLRKKFGVQFLLDVIRQHYTDSSTSVLSKEDKKTLRNAIFGLVKYFLQKEVNAKEVSALTNFTFFFRRTNILEEVISSHLLITCSKSGALCVSRELYVSESKKK